jgi:hypothetical protein
VHPLLSPTHHQLNCSDISTSVAMVPRMQDSRPASPWSVPLEHLLLSLGHDAMSHAPGLSGSALSGSALSLSPLPPPLPPGPVALSFAVPCDSGAPQAQSTSSFEATFRMLIAFLAYCCSFKSQAQVWKNTLKVMSLNVVPLCNSCLHFHFLGSCCAGGTVGCCFSVMLPSVTSIF